jgi:diaminohydroxyphosphoribosylaminopyrimidine deaminase / 5-amino-6-(5-phosphoribosylamino)uracil reductase
LFGGKDMEKYMKRAIELAERGVGFVNPNPLVGAVIVKDGAIVGEGYHAKCGENHAEINAFEDAAWRGESVEGATMYVTLEPCSHYGKTPPCADAIIEKKIAKVVIGLVDPNPLVAGRGAEKLRGAGIEVVTGVMESEIRRQNEIFLSYIGSKKPFCIMKTAMTLDGKICTKNGDSKWITNEKSRRYVHELRHRVSAVMVGINTVIADDPMLNTRLEDRIPSDSVKVVVDSKGRIPLSCKLLTMGFEKETIVATTERAPKDKLDMLESMGCRVIVSPEKHGRVDLAHVMAELGKLGIDSVLLEGGGSLNFGALREKIVNKVECFVAPLIIGGRDSKTPVEGDGVDYVKDGIKVDDIEISEFDGDILIKGYIGEV